MAPYARIINQSLTPVETSDPVLKASRANETRSIKEARRLSSRLAVVPWSQQVGHNG